MQVNRSCLLQRLSLSQLCSTYLSFLTQPQLCPAPAHAHLGGASRRASPVPGCCPAPASGPAPWTASIISPGTAGSACGCFALAGGGEEEQKHKTNIKQIERKTNAADLFLERLLLLPPAHTHDTRQTHATHTHSVHTHRHTHTHLLTHPARVSSHEPSVWHQYHSARIHTVPHTHTHTHTMHTHTALDGKHQYHTAPHTHTDTHCTHVLCHTHTASTHTHTHTHSPCSCFFS